MAETIARAYSDESYVFSPPDCGSGASFRNCNLMQKLPHTKVFEFCADLVFRDCNLVNCDVPPDSIVERCLTIHRDFCFHLHPEWDLPAEEEDCRHVIAQHEILVDGKSIGIEYEREDILL